MSQYKIPQKTQREDKIIGPLTAKQLLYAFLTIASSYLLYQSINLNPIVEFNSMERILILAPFALLGAAFTLVEINERPFEIYFAAFLQFLLHPRIRVWQKEIPELTYSTTPKENVETTEQKMDASATTSPVSRAAIERLSQIMDAPEQVAPLPKAPSSKTQALLNIVQETEAEKSPMRVIAKPKGGGIFPSFALLSKIQGFFFGSGIDSNKTAKRNNQKPNTDKAGEETKEEQETTDTSAAPLSSGILSTNKEASPSIKNDAANLDAPPATPVQQVSKFDIKLPSELSIEDLIAQAQQNQNNNTPS